MAFAIKTDLEDAGAASFVFASQKTMYGGKHISKGDDVFIFADGDGGLVARGVVTRAEPVDRIPGLARQTPRVSIEVRRTGRATQRLGRRELKQGAGSAGGEACAELVFKFYRQATNKIVGVSDGTTAFLDGCIGDDLTTAA